MSQFEMNAEMDISKNQWRSAEIIFAKNFARNHEKNNTWNIRCLVHDYLSHRPSDNIEDCWISCQTNFTYSTAQQQCLNAKMLYRIYRKTSLLSARQLSCFSTQCIFGQKFYVNIQSFSEHHQIAGKNPQLHTYLFCTLLVPDFCYVHPILSSFGFW